MKKMKTVAWNPYKLFFAFLECLILEGIRFEVVPPPKPAASPEDTETDVPCRVRVLGVIITGWPVEVEDRRDCGLIVEFSHFFLRVETSAGSGSPKLICQSEEMIKRYFTKWISNLIELHIIGA